MKHPVLSIVGGRGSGKTTLVQYLLPQLSAGGMRVHVPRDNPQHAQLDELLQEAKCADLSLVEGFQREPIPKLEIYRSGLDMPALYPHDSSVIAVATDIPPPGQLRKRLIWLDITQPAQVLAWLQVYLHMRLPPPVLTGIL